MSGGVVLPQERHVRLHVRVDLFEIRFVGQLDDKHSLRGSEVQGFKVQVKVQGRDSGSGL
jgi:hypothetical protein